MKHVSPVVLAFLVLSLLAGCQHLAPVGAANRSAWVSYSDPTALSALISRKTEPYYLIDVRTMKEYSTGYIPTAINIPFDELPKRPPTQDKSAIIILYCQSGIRSAKSAAMLKALGYTHVVEFGAISRWVGTLVRSPKPGLCLCEDYGAGSSLLGNPNAAKQLE